MNKLAVTLLCVLCLGLGGTVGQLMYTSTAEKLRVKVNDALDLAERSQANTDKCLKHVSTLVNKVNDALDLAERSQANTDKCLKHVSTLVNIVWDYTPEQIQEIRNTIPKPLL